MRKNYYTLVLASHHKVCQWRVVQSLPEARSSRPWIPAIIQKNSVHCLGLLEQTIPHQSTGGYPIVRPMPSLQEQQAWGLFAPF